MYLGCSQEQFSEPWGPSEAHLEWSSDPGSEHRMGNAEGWGGRWNKSEGEVISEREGNPKRILYGLISNLKEIARISVLHHYHDSLYMWLLYSKRFLSGNKLK